MNQPKPRKWYYTLLAVAKRDLNMDEDQYRATLAEFGAKQKSGKPSASTMTVPQLEHCLEHFKSLGFKVRRPRSHTNPKEAQLKKIQAMWNELHAAGVLRQPYSEKSVTLFGARMTKVNNIRWATPLGLAKVIEALKGIANREGVRIET